MKVFCLVRQFDGRIQPCQELDERLAFAAHASSADCAHKCDRRTLRRLDRADRDLPGAVDEVFDVRQWGQYLAYAAFRPPSSRSLARFHGSSLSTRLTG